MADDKVVSSLSSKQDRLLSMQFLSILFYIFTCINLSDGSKQRLGFASKTPYFYDETQIKQLDMSTECKVTHINFLARHGTRYPSAKDIKKINTMVHLVNQLYTSHGRFTFDKVKFPWVSPFAEHHDKTLTGKGEQELYEMAKRLCLRYPDFINSQLSHKRLKFSSTQTSRSLNSAMAFSIGLLEGTGKLGACGIRPVPIESRDINNDTVLRFFDVCPKYLTSVSKNKSSLFEHHDFKYTQHMTEVVDHVRQQFGNSPAIMAKHVIGMFIACTFEYAVFERDDTWCSLFRPEDMNVMEYYYDLKHFWKRGWGYDINLKMACPLLSAMFADIKNSLNTSDIHRDSGVFRFAHGETLQPLYCLLGLFKDTEMLRANNYHHHTERYYRTSRIVPFAANIAFVVYNCSAGEQEDFKVEVLVNEQPVSIPCCGADTKCPWELFSRCYEDIVKNCDLDGVCAQNEPEMHHEEL